MTRSNLKSPVVAAVTNYNMASSLKMLLGQLVKEDYDDIFVLDDASTDESLKVARKFSHIHIVAGKNNLGPGGNRNRIIEALDYDAIIHFLDADVALASHNNPDHARTLFKDRYIGIVGGLVSLPDGKQMIFNFGPKYSLYSHVGGALQSVVRNHLWRQLFHYFLKDFPDPARPVKRKEVFWVSEANMLVPSTIYKQVGGFDARLPYHEIQDLAMKLRQLGYGAVYDSGIKVVHPFFKLHSRKRHWSSLIAGLLLIRIYGLSLK